MASVIGTLAGLPILFGNSYLYPLTTTTLAAVEYAVSQGSPTTTAMHVIQRAPGLTTRDIPVVFGFTGAAPTSVQGRVRKRSDSSVMRDWFALTGLTTASVTGTGVLPGVPQGSDYILDVRDGVTQPTSGPLYSSTTQRWGVGVVILAQGQSNMVATLNGGYLGYTVPGTSIDENGFYQTGASPGGIFDTAGFHAPSNGNGYFGPQGYMNTASNCIWMFLRLVTKGLRTKYGYDVPVALSPYAIASQTIESFTAPSGTHYLEIMAGSGTGTSGVGFSSAPPDYCGDFEGVLWHQGEANNGDSTATYQGKLVALYQGYLAKVSPYGRTAAQLFFLPAVIGNIDVAVGAQLELIRSAQQTFEAYAGTQGWSAARVGWTTVDLVRGDQYHLTAPGTLTSMRRAIQSTLYRLGAATYSGRGVNLGGVSRSGLVATISVTHVGGTALTAPTPAGAITGFQANTAADFSGTGIIVTAAITSATTVAVTFPSGTTFPVYLKYLGGVIGTAASCNPDVSNAIYDNASYPSNSSGVDVEALGLPVLPTTIAITIT